MQHPALLPHCGEDDASNAWDGIMFHIIIIFILLHLQQRMK